jgi:hypothetical protein
VTFWPNDATILPAIFRVSWSSAVLIMMFMFTLMSVAGAIMPFSMLPKDYLH